MSANSNNVSNRLKNHEKKIKHKEKMSREASLFKTSVIFILIGVIILIGTSYYSYRIDNGNYVPNTSAFNEQSDSSNPDTNDAISNTKQNISTGNYILIEVLNNIGTILIVFAISNLVLDRYSNIKYFKERIAELFLDFEMVNILDDVYKQKLKRNLIKSTFSVDNEDTDSLTDLLDTEVNNLLKSYYYADNYTVINCSLIHNGKYIQKNIVKKMVVKNITTNSEVAYSRLLNISCPEIKEQSIIPLIINSIQIDKKTLSPKNDYHVSQKHEKGTINSNHPYIINSVCDLSEPIKIKDSINITINYTTITPIEDNFYSCRMDRLCKNLRCKFFFEDTLKVEARGFSFATKQSSGLQIEYNNCLCEVQSNNWVLPGEGVVFTLFTPTSKSTP